MITVRRITHNVLLYGSGPDFLKEYAEECSIPALGRTDPQWETYDRMERAGLLHGFGVFVDERLAGFAAVLISVLPHYGKRVATVESLFVGKDFRSVGAGTALMAEVEKYADEMGCEALLVTAPTGSKLEALLDRRYKYARTNTVFCKPLVAKS